MPATLLAVDDSVTMRKVLEITFAGEDFRVVTADGADAALMLVKSEAPSVVLADCTLAGKSGYDLCSAIKRDAPQIPVLLLSSKLNPYDRGKGQASGADDYIDKPFDTQELIEKVNRLLLGKEKQVQGPFKAGPAPHRTPAAKEREDEKRSSNRGDPILIPPSNPAWRLRRLPRGHLQQRWNRARKALRARGGRRERGTERRQRNRAR